MSARDDERHASDMADAAPSVLRMLGLCPSCGGDTIPKGSGYRCATCKGDEEINAEQSLAHFNEHAGRAEYKRQRRNRDG